MSRSYKKTPWCGDSKGKSKTRIANHIERQYLKNHMDLNLAPGDYKKLYETWDICDYGWTLTWEQYWKSEWRSYRWICSMFPNREHKEPDKQECYRKWLKYYHSK